MMHAVCIKHNFETAHRLPHLGNQKCRNIHGHSWNVSIWVDGPKQPDGTVIEFGWLKHHIRSWIDENLDHGAMLGYQDKLLPAFVADGSKVYVFGEGKLAAGLDWPTVENVAEVIWRMVDDLLQQLMNYDKYDINIHLFETAVNGVHFYREVIDESQ